MVRYGRETGRGIMMAGISGAPCIHCGAVTIYDNDDWWQWIVTELKRLPDQRIPPRGEVEAYMDRWNISEEMAEDTTIELLSKLRYNPKTQRWAGEKTTYADFFRTWQTWARRNKRADGNRNGHSEWKPQAPRSRYI